MATLMAAGSRNSGEIDKFLIKFNYFLTTGNAGSLDLGEVPEVHCGGEIIKKLIFWYISKKMCLIFYFIERPADFLVTKIGIKYKN